MKKIYEDENHTTEFDFSNAISVFEPHCLASYHSEYISDVDFVLESNENIFFFEYKNGNIAGATNPSAFEDKIKNGSLATVLTKKFYGTLLVVLMTDINSSKKPVRYSCVIETGKGIDNVMMKKLRNKVHSNLPFDYETHQEIKVPIIDQFELIDVDGWNTIHPEYPIRVKEMTEK